jgi:cytochrome c peroxidase
MDSFNIAGTGANAGKTLLTRHVVPRNVPSVVNSIFYIRAFWDGRANNVFNGVDPFGLRNANARLLVADSSGVSLQPFAIGGAALASQAVGPALSDFEMSCSNRTFADIGKKLENLAALSGQAVDANDSLLGAPGPFGDLRAGNPPGSSSGLNIKYTYAALIKKAFAPRYWQDTNKWRVVNGQLVKDATGYTQLESNFSMFWGIAIMLYESTLVSDDSPFDRYMDGGMNPVPGFGDAEIRGMEVFGNEGACIHCHTGPVFSSAAIGVNFVVENNVVERMTMADGGVALYDNGFYNIGVRPTRDDPGVGGIDPFGYPLSFTRQYVANPFFPAPDNFSIDPCQFINPFPNCTVLPSDFGPLTQRVAVDGSFKVPSLRNVALTPPYFHNGGQGTLAQVVQFYNRGGDARTLPGGTGDTSGTGAIGGDDFNAPAAGSNLHPLMFNRGLTAQQQSDLVAFLKSLTDDRVRCASAPFDHPGLAVPTSVNTAGTPNGAQAAEYKMALAATGKDGLPATKCSLIRNDGDVDQLSGTLTGLAK